MDRLSYLKYLNARSGLFICDYFEAIRFEIDIECETRILSLILDSNENCGDENGKKKRDDDDDKERRAEVEERLNLHRKCLLDRLRRLESRLLRFHSNRIHIDDTFNGDVDDEINKLERFYLDDKQILFGKSSDDINLGFLFTLKGVHFNQVELNLIK